MDVTISMILREEDQDLLKRLKEYFENDVGVDISRTEMIRHCIRKRIEQLFPSE